MFNRQLIERIRALEAEVRGLQKANHDIFRQIEKLGYVWVTKETLPNAIEDPNNKGNFYMGADREGIETPKFFQMLIDLLNLKVTEATITPARLTSELKVSKKP